MEVLYDTREKPRQEDTTYIENIAIAFCTKFGLKTLLFRPTQKKRYNGITVFLRKTNVKHM